MKNLNLRSETTKFSDRKMSALIQWMMEHSGVTKTKLAGYLDCSLGYFNNKLTRNSWSFDDLVIAAYASGMCFVLDDGEEQYSINIVDWFADYDLESLQRIVSLKRQSYENAKEVYLAKKKELEEIKQKYGFKD